MLKAGFVILNYNDAETTINLVNLVNTFECISNIVVVDNCSTDNSYRKLLELKKGNVEVVKSDRNGGYASGNNFGIKYMINKYPIDIVFIANPDIVVSEELILNIIDNFGNSNYDMLSGIMTDANGEISTSPAWKIPTYKDDVLNSFVLLSKWRNKRNSICIDYSKPIMDVEVLSGSFFAIRSSVLEKVGFFDEKTFLYCEERILARKLKDIGLKVGLLTGFTYLHVHSTSIMKSMKIIQMRKALFKSRYYYQVEYNNINILQRLVLRICMSVSLLDYSAYLFMKKCIGK